ncbi:Alpha/Beta hydrolase protein [Calycina marina]|uniref:Kynurenine formamidase n=1 Tax=Calycina marina TaxID=1763456 RepID=A0A9P7Z3I7_9HELO|nr:Alpha/Beta hydrolase protein [Calycina marina]
MERTQDSSLSLKESLYVTGNESTALHTVDIWQPKNGIKSNGIWLVFIHGGAWRDPLTDSKSFQPAVSDLWNSDSAKSIAGFASINYRLSPYPNKVEAPSSPDDPSRNVCYPAHLSDVEKALLYLEAHYQIANRYVLIGHSAGATMAMELQTCSLPNPLAVLGIAGIYDFDGLLEAHHHPTYKEFMENAFPDRSTWKKAAPCTNLSLDNLYERAKLVIISYSDDDELIEVGQAKSMLERIKAGPAPQGRVHVVKATGHHDEMWEGDGHVLAGVIRESLELIQNDI